MNLPAPPLMVITDRRQAFHPLPEIIQSVLAAGCRWVSLREKDLPPAEQVALARVLLPLARRHGATFTVHGDPAIAAAAGADGVHLAGGGDCAAARGLLGRDALIGISIHRSDETTALDPQIVDYAIAGPLHQTSSKPRYGPPLSDLALKTIAQRSAVPILGIGGVVVESVAYCRAAGLMGIAVMGSVMRSTNPGIIVGNLLDTLAQTHSQACAPSDS